MSRLPRRTARQPSVAELVKKYQDFLPPQGIHDLAKTAFPPKIVVSESEQEYTKPARTGVRGKSRHRILAKKPSNSDFEQGYAASIAPRYLTHPRRSFVHTGARISGQASTFESRDSSRRPSPEKRSSNRAKDVRFGRSNSPSGKNPSLTSVGTKSGKGKTSQRTRERTPSRSSSIASKTAFRRPSNTTGSKVSNIAKHFERLGREAERSRSRYNVIRGRRARPVASARAKVEVLDSIKDAIQDESESSDSSSEADDEGDGNDMRLDRSSVSDPVQGQQTDSPESDTVPNDNKNVHPVTETPVVETLATDTNQEADPPPLPMPTSLPPSPFLPPVRLDPAVSLTSPHSDLDIGTGGTERNSILKALSGFWLQPPVPRNAIEVEDPMHDPEHIFRDSSMVVRTDEPTSIIALALKYALLFF